MSQRVLAVSALITASLACYANPTYATPLADGFAVAKAATSDVQSVRWGWGGFGWGLGAGLLGGAIIGGALAAPYAPYPPGYYYGPPAPYYPPAAYYPAPGYAAPGYAAPGYAAPGYAAPGYPAPVAGDASAYCARRYHSYDPASGTFLGNDGIRHHCP